MLCSPRFLRRLQTLNKRGIERESGGHERVSPKRRWKWLYINNVQLAQVNNAKTYYERIQNEHTKEIDFFTFRWRRVAGHGDSRIRPIRYVGV